MERKKIVHIVQFDKKFTLPYYYFFETKMKSYQHKYFYIDKVNNEDYLSDKVPDDSLLFLLSKKNKALFSSEIANAYRIIVSGVFSLYIPLFIPKKFRDKVILHFWGGDYTQYREKSLIKKIKKIYMASFINDCRCVLNLIDGEYEVFQEIFKNAKNHGTARFPSLREKTFDYKKIMEDISVVPHRIIIGNSATPSNQHIEVFNILKKFSNKDLEIHCPLVYGDKLYREKVITEGKKIFGDKFYSYLEMQPLEDYIKLLATCEVGIFNNDRQQALGNIKKLLLLGKKVYIRDDTPMWKWFKEKEITVFNVSDLSNITYIDLFKFDKLIGEINSKQIVLNSNITETEKEWKNVFEDKY